MPVIYGPVSDRVATCDSRSDENDAAAWRTLTLEMVGSTITPSVDGKSLGSHSDPSGPKHGMAAVGSGWHVAYFDDFALKPMAADAF